MCEVVFLAYKMLQYVLMPALLLGGMENYLIPRPDSVSVRLWPAGRRAALRGGCGTALREATTGDSYPARHRRVYDLWDVLELSAGNVQLHGEEAVDYVRDLVVSWHFGS